MWRESLCVDATKKAEEKVFKKKKKCIFEYVCTITSPSLHIIIPVNLLVLFIMVNTHTEITCFTCGLRPQIQYLSSHLD